MQKRLNCFSSMKMYLHVFSRKIDIQNDHLTGIFSESVKHYPHLTKHKTKTSKH